MSEKPTVIKKTREEVLATIQDLLSCTPYESIGALREAVDCDECCQTCYNYTAPYAEVWSELGGWLYLADIDWRTAE